MSTNADKMILLPLDPLTRLLDEMRKLGENAQGVIIPSEFHECEDRTSEGPSATELEAIRDRLQRIFGQLHRLHPIQNGETSPAPKRKLRGKAVVGPVIIIAGIRLYLDQIEGLLARVAPHESSGRSADWKFHGKVKMSRADGDAIRAEFQRVGDAVYIQWCLNTDDHPRGVPRGQGIYTKMQVAAAIAHGSGEHR